MTGADPDTDYGYVQHLVGMGGAPAPSADITFAGWLPAGFMAAAGVPGSVGVALPAAWETDGSLAWGLSRDRTARRRRAAIRGVGG